MAQRWLDYSYILRGNPEPARIIQVCKGESLTLTLTLPLPLTPTLTLTLALALTTP